ncbi:Rossmann-like alpha/beta/alpha sandwich fold containing protein [Parasponia andersonii]|uniref:Rossmann-like alpha/beta/alpha sandwich fold containing protein n=1 Tax=Parasponia andersonii TaxID=3476 RepID=A0A2P5E2N1_PARAD|nr:Rossmann-like alpha/beta/alpha sandwich fold containing protein [Parasponia andersonii]
MLLLLHVWLSNYIYIILIIWRREKLKEITQRCEELKKTHEEEKNNFEYEKKQLQEVLAKDTEGKKFEEKANDIATSTTVYNICCKYLKFDFLFVGEDIVKLVKSWKASEAMEEVANDGGIPTE